MTAKQARRRAVARGEARDEANGTTRQESAGEAAFARALRLFGDDLSAPQREVEFARAAFGRKWRADFLWPGLIVEIDGGRHAPGGGRHAGDADKDKLNHAAVLGYRVLRFSPQQVERDPAGCVELVRKALEVQS